MKAPKLTMLIAAALLLLPVTILRAQKSSPTAQFKGKVEVKEVLLDALVTDRHGDVVLGLGKNDFVVKENGKPVPLTGAAFYSNRRFLESNAMAKKLGIDPKSTPTNRYFILFFHDQRDLSSSFVSRQMDAGRQAKEWLDKNLLPNDYVAVVSYHFRLQLQQDFTNDRKLVDQGIDMAIQGKDLGKEWPSRRHDMKSAGPSLFAYMPTGTKLRDATTRIYGALEVIARAATHTVGRKNLVMFSAGYGDWDQPGPYRPDPRFYPQMVHSLNNANVAVYTVDTKHFSASPNPVERRMRNSLNQLASDTGGHYYYNFTNFATPLKEISLDNNGYYLLSYRSTHPAGASGYQRVTVTTKNRDFRVRARTGYFYGQEHGSNN
ncbi:MAG TPA: VWA domain-containing protein [Thermoanaerobaculia bacterium]|nr:VWA domain-containing protein [Thermoanaerobaculia bacterium]